LETKKDGDCRENGGPVLQHAGVDYNALAEVVSDCLDFHQEVRCGLFAIDDDLQFAFYQPQVKHEKVED
jgi:hypothetical protein